jgi:ferrous iron transport protein B
LLPRGVLRNNRIVMKKARQVAAIPLREPLYRGKRRLRIALVGMPNSGKSTLFNAVSSTSIRTGELGGTRRAYNECAVQIGLDEARVIELPSIQTLHDLPPDDLVALQYLLWGDELPPVKVHERGGPPAPFAPPDVIIQVVDATALARHLELTLELSQLGRPMVIALNMMDEAWNKGLHIKPAALSRQLGIPVVPTVALMGQGIAKLFKTAVEAVRGKSCPLPHPASKHLCDKLQPLSQALNRPEIQAAFRVPHPLLVMQLAQNDRYFRAEMQQHFPELLPQLMQLRSAAEQALPRPLAEELHADRHHRAAMLVESVTRLGAPHEGRGWRYWLDELFLHPQWGLLGSLAVFAVVLFVVFEVSVWIDSLTSARLVEWISVWQPQTTGGVIGRAVADGLIGLVGIVVPYMLPLVLLLVALEESGIMQRIAFVVDRGFHHLGLHGGVAVPFLTGLGCNVPALSAVSRVTRGRERLIASVLITFVPCSARSAIILALAGKYLGGLGVFAIFLLSMIVIALLGKVLARRYPESGPGQVQEIPSYALPRLATLLPATWDADPRHSHHRDAPARRRQRGAGAADARRRRRRHQYRVHADHRLVARPAGVARRADPVRRPAQGAVAADGLPGARHLRHRRASGLGADHDVSDFSHFLLPVRVDLRGDAQDHRPPPGAGVGVAVDRRGAGGQRDHPLGVSRGAAGRRLRLGD